jgi:hypothetical protein
MPCSRCHQYGHNARNRLCPAIQPQTQDDIIQPSVVRTSLVQTNIVRTRAELRTRGLSGRRRPAPRGFDTLLWLVRSFENACPVGICMVSNSEEPYSMHRLPRNLMINTIFNVVIVEQFVRNGLVNVCQISANHIVGLFVRTESAQISLLRDVPYPTDTDVFILIPQLPGVTIRNETGLYLESSQILIPHQRPRSIQGSDFAKSWNIVLDLSKSTDSTCDDDCVICFEPKPRKQFAKTNCNHEFCVECVKSHVQSNKFRPTQIVCPMCRSDIKELSITDVYIHSNFQEFIVSL